MAWCASSASAGTASGFPSTRSSSQSLSSQEGALKLKWLGHAAFLATAADGTRLLTDPYHVSDEIGYRPVTDPAEIVLVSHDHSDHNAVETVGGTPTIIRRAGVQTVRGIRITGVEFYHDQSRGRERGRTIAFVFVVDDIRIGHLGDLGHELKPADAKRLGPIDVLLVPVGGNFTIDAPGATAVVAALAPAVTIPMHYRTAVLPDFPVAGVDEFLAGKKAVRLPVSEVEITRSRLPAAPEVWVLKHAN